MNFGYFIGMGWLIVVQFLAYESSSDQENFLTFEGHGGGLENDHDHDHQKWSIITVYFTITSLSTVGFGDFTPRSDIERCIGAFLLLGGVLIFSNLMNKFNETIQQTKKFNANLEQEDQL